MWENNIVQRKLIQLKFQQECVSIKRNHKTEIGSMWMEMKEELNKKIKPGKSTEKMLR